MKNELIKISNKRRNIGRFVEIKDINALYEYYNNAINFQQSKILAE